MDTDEFYKDTPYRKRKPKKSAKKSKHKHDYTDCIFSYPSTKYSKDKGFYKDHDDRNNCLGRYCKICGKVTVEYMLDFNRDKNDYDRSLPVFLIDDLFRLEYIPLPDDEKE